MKSSPAPPPRDEHSSHADLFPSHFFLQPAPDGIIAQGHPLELRTHLSLWVYINLISVESVLNLKKSAQGFKQRETPLHPLASPSGAYHSWLPNLGAGIVCFLNYTDGRATWEASDSPNGVFICLVWPSEPRAWGRGSTQDLLLGETSHLQVFFLFLFN